MLKIIEKNLCLNALHAVAYQLENTSSHMITEVKQCEAQLLLRWETVPSVV